MKKLKSFCCSVFLVLVSMYAVAQPQLDANKMKQLIVQDAEKQGIQKLPEVMAEIREAQSTVLIRAWEKKALAEQPVTQEMKLQVYKELSVFLGDSEYKIFQVFLDSEEAAQALIKAMVVDPKWEALNIKNIVGDKAKFSINQSDWVNVTAVLSEFRPVVKSLKQGEVAAKPVRVQAGWHVVGLLEKRPLVMPAAEKIDKDLVGLVERKIIGQKMQSLLGK
jgi:peptidyl-prolyl cis-trans isomerase C